MPKTNKARPAGEEPSARLLFSEFEAGLARALLLGDGTAMDRNEWDSFVRTGVVHALAISGQKAA